MYIADMSGFCGHAPDPVVGAVAHGSSGETSSYCPPRTRSPSPSTCVRYGLPQWQFTLSATQANTEVIRLAREMTGRETILLFDGKYHGEGDATLVVLEDGEVVPEMQGLPRWVPGQARVVPFNDVAAVEAALEPDDVALVLAEPAMTNAGFLFTEDGFHDGLRRLTREDGTLLAIDEVH